MAASASYNWRAGSRRSANVIEPHHQRLESADKSRWALGRYVKLPLGDHRFDAVEVWSLRHRVNGKVVEVAFHRDRAEAEAWVAGLGQPGTL